ncbi:MAG: hypothetical protein KAQ98_08465 [Bacteriovoracaceae bacterium]|nr:hypothetical protein [Bacteriovoracaceae bacterium]
MTTEILSESMERNDNNATLMEEDKIELSSLSEMTGFPVEFIKQELLITGDRVSLKGLRKAMLGYLDNTFKK